MSYISLKHLSELMNQYWFIIIDRSPYFFQISLVFTKGPFSPPGSHLGYCIRFNHHVSLGSSWLLCFWRLDNFEAYWSEHPSVGICVIVFSFAWYVSWAKKFPKEFKFYPNFLESSGYQSYLSWGRHVVKTQGISNLGPGAFLQVKNWKYHRKQKGPMPESWFDHSLDFCIEANKLIS